MSERKRELKTVPISCVHRSIVELRAPQTEDAKFIETRDSIKLHGILQAPIVRPLYAQDIEYIEKNTGVVVADLEGEQYAIVDGLQRFTCAVELGMTEIDVISTDLSIEEALIIQFVANDKGIPTKPGEFSKQMVRLLSADPSRTAQSLADDLCISLNSIKTALKLKGLNDDILALVDNGMIKLSNAYSLATLPVAEHESFVARAQSDDANQFGAAVRERKSTLAKDARTGTKVEAVFAPTRKRRATSEIESAIETAGNLCSAKDVKGFKLGLQYAISLDDATVNAEEEKWNLKKADSLAKKEARKVVAAEKKAVKDAKDKAEKAEAEANQNPLGALSDLAV
jgi:ParB-like chromosome segregation protein Spo0J